MINVKFYNKGQLAYERAYTKKRNAVAIARGWCATGRRASNDATLFRGRASTDLYGGVALQQGDREAFVEAEPTWCYVVFFNEEWQPGSTHSHSHHTYTREDNARKAAAWWVAHGTKSPNVGAEFPLQEATCESLKGRDVYRCVTNSRVAVVYEREEKFKAFLNWEDELKRLPAKAELEPEFEAEGDQMGSEEPQRTEYAINSWVPEPEPELEPKPEPDGWFTERKIYSLSDGSVYECLQEAVRAKHHRNLPGRIFVDFLIEEVR